IISYLQDSASGDLEYGQPADQKYF
ncbi:MAG: hypothetical protein H6Q23_430, partial [Bacteroidetes bacterium]|nr:hypothetical protein [Bacteroidota bacterium]